MTTTSTLQYRPAQSADIPRCIEIRGRTRENAISAAQLAELGITAQTWGAAVAAGETLGFVCSDGASGIVGYCYGDAASGEVLVLALLPTHEDRGIGRELLQRVMIALRERGHRRLFLGCSDDPTSRSHGFYRHLGWRPTGARDALGDEELEFLFPDR
ncbi:GNAT family N-acetyltransferase [Roseateles sp. DAIF2]|uniref:GNAT family N-acetyltransferase n=1 Tax=Roseateles sp. DAIF2 TaxID=2714952 RepID=UPI0018A2D6E1|nr:GNAT family N-acetyltransferase [Roseateles sp. DAIF2]QPF75025.1 GNAT family N-acetyltransferase [Roseateles sp. DAIF2]